MSRVTLGHMWVICIPKIWDTWIYDFGFTIYDRKLAAYADMLENEYLLPMVGQVILNAIFHAEHYAFMSFKTIFP